MRKKVLRGALLTLALLFAFTLVPAAALAHEGEERSEDSSTTSSHEEQNDGDSLRDKIEAKRAERKAAGQKRLEAAKQRLCETRKTKIAAIMKRASARAENHIKVFDSITTRVKDFYQKKGKVLSNYDELVAAVDAAKAKANADITTLKTLETLDCSSEDPKGNIDDFKTALKTVTEDLKAYRTAVKNLIVGVKSVQGDGNE